MVKKIDCTIRGSLFYIVTVYQKLLSPNHSFWGRYVYPYGYCRYYPTCSNYAKDALSTFVLPRALILIGRRLLTCHPWALGGFDYIPDQKKG